MIGRNVILGQKIQLAIFGINGPLSSPSTNFIWLHYATLELYDGPQGPMAVTPYEVNVEVVRKDAAINELISNNLKIFKLAEGFKFPEDPLWAPSEPGRPRLEAHGLRPAPGYLLFSDPNSHTMYKWAPEGDGYLAVFRTPSGHTGADVADYRQPGSNGPHNMAWRDADGKTLYLTAESGL